ncbi:hypothetical protein DFH06DRAFT_1189325 [Mycena polygramma]|nr:hypothetical protein DFH06DRAFT_1189325 [Mycena polygramma]
MDSSLRFENLSALPFTIRRAALAAIRGSQADFTKVVQIISADPGVAAHKFLPMIAALLDPARLPDKHMLIEPPHMVALDMAYHATLSLSLFTALPISVLKALWPRAWMWAQRIEELELQDSIDIADTDSGPGLDTSMELLKALWPFIKSAALQPTVHSTPGFHAFVAGIWPRLHSSHPEVPLARTAFYRFISSCDKDCAERSGTEFIEGCGGDPSALASLLVRDISMAAAACLYPKAEEPRMDLLKRLSAFDAIIMGNPDLFPPLLRAGIIKAQTNAIARLGCFPDAEATLNKSFLQLNAFLVFGSGFPHLPDALRAGLLVNILAFSVYYQPSERSEAVLVATLRLSLPPALVYYRVVSALALAFPMVMEMPYNPRFIASPIYSAWQDFAALVQARLRLLEYFDSDEYIRTKACDNFECGVIRKASELKRCAGCREQFYCSRQCHIADWRRGGHRESCKISYSADDLQWTKRDDAFLRLILHREYQAHKVDLLMRQLAYMSPTAGPHVFSTTFNFLSGRCTVTVRPGGPDSFRKLGFTDRQIAEASRSGSRLALHRVVLYRGQNMKVVRPYVLRCGSSALVTGLEEIRVFMKRTGDKEEARRRIRVLCLGEMLETHG